MGRRSSGWSGLHSTLLGQPFPHCQRFTKPESYEEHATSSERAHIRNTHSVLSYHQAEATRVWGRAQFTHILITLKSLLLLFLHCCFDCCLLFFLFLFVLNVSSGNEQNKNFIASSNYLFCCAYDSKILKSWSNENIYAYIIIELQGNVVIQYISHEKRGAT